MAFQITFLGAAQNVTGSSYLLENGDTKIMVDCGMYQERALLERNWAAFGVDPKTIDVILLTHAHLDHCGLLPRLVKQGFRGRVICTRATAEIAEIVMKDAAHIQLEDMEFKRKRHEREGRESKFPAEPLYTLEDVEEAVKLFKGVDYKQIVTIGDGMQAEFRDAGHIFGASMIKLTVQHNGQPRSILFSGDVGREDKPILHDPSFFQQADYVVMESTYGDRIHKQNQDVKDRFAEVINETHKAGGNLVIPSFAIERCQELLYYLNDLLQEDRIPHLMTFLDSPMAIRVTEVFKKHPELYDHEAKEWIYRNGSLFDFPGLVLTRTSQSSKGINHIKGTAIIIAGSGMCTGGRIKHHLVNNISRPESTILFVGYQANGTLGRIILDGLKNVRILGQKRPVNARIERIEGFSAHADQKELLDWVGHLKNQPKGVFLTHGEADSARALGEKIQQKFGWEVTIPEYKQRIQLD